MDRWQITNATLVFPDEAASGGLLIEQGRIKSVLKAQESVPDVPEVDLHGLPLYPGLINGHDTLLATYTPLPAPARPFSSWLAYDNALKSSELFRERMLIDTADLYLLGAYRNLLSGTTTVVDHIPEFVRSPFKGQLPVHLLEDFGIAHAVGESSLGWGRGVQIEHQKAVQQNLPFIIHIAEGTDEGSRESLAILAALGALSEHTVLLSGVGLSRSDLRLIAEAGAHLVWCPTASKRLFGREPDIAAAIEFGVNVCLGTDAAMTGSLHLLAELREALAGSSEGLDARKVFAMATANPGRAFRLASGSLKAGQLADFFVLTAKGDPYERVTRANPEDLFLVVVEGSPAFGDQNAAEIFQKAGVPVDMVSVGGREKWVVAGLGALFGRIELASGKKPALPFLSARIMEGVS